MRGWSPRIHPAAGAAALLAPLALLLLVDPAGAHATARSGGRIDAAALFNAGTDAIDHGDFGPAVAFLRAAQRIDPRATDIRHNLTEARARAAAGWGGGDASPPAPARTPLLSSAEGCWLAAALLLLGAALAFARLLRQEDAGGSGRRGARAVAWASTALVVAGAILTVLYVAGARQEAAHPEAVVVVPVLEVGPAPDERPRPPYLLGAGEEVRLGRERGTLVEIRIGGTAVGWASRSGVWRVADAARYTARFQ